jgi:hypothetical protein
MKLSRLLNRVKMTSSAFYIIAVFLDSLSSLPCLIASNISFIVILVFIPSISSNGDLNYVHIYRNILHWYIKNY